MGGGKAPLKVTSIDFSSPPPSKYICLSRVHGFKFNYVWTNQVPVCHMPRENNQTILRIKQVLSPLSESKQATPFFLPAVPNREQSKYWDLTWDYLFRKPLIFYGNKSPPPKKIISWEQVFSMHWWAGLQQTQQLNIKNIINSYHGLRKLLG